MCKKLILVLLVLCMAAASQAYFVETWDSFANGSTIQGTNGWTAGTVWNWYYGDGAIVDGAFGTAGNRAMAGVTNGGGGQRNITGDVAGDGSYEIRAIALLPAGSTQSQVGLVIGDATLDGSTSGSFGSGRPADDDNCFFMELENNGGTPGISFHYFSGGVVNTSGASDAVAPDYSALGWFEIKLAVSAAGVGQGTYRDLDDSTGAPTSAWSVLGTFDSAASFSAATRAGVVVRPEAAVDVVTSGIPEPATIALLGLGALSLIRKRK